MRPAQFLLPLALLAGSCRSVPDRPPVDRGRVTAAVLATARQVADDLAAVGPEAWLGHFEDADGFFMASDGALVFPDFAAAARFVTPFDPTIASVELEWLDPRVEPISHDAAVLHAGYREFLVDVDGAETRYAGYFTALVVKTPEGWRIRNAHWSSPRPSG